MTSESQNDYLDHSRLVPCANKDGIQKCLFCLKGQLTPSHDSVNTAANISLYFLIPLGLEELRLYYASICFQFPMKVSVFNFTSLSREHGV